MLIDSGEADGHLFYVMPFVDGESLQDRLKREGTLPLHEAVRLMDQVASALSHAHAHDVIHRDVKPANILLAGDQAIVAERERRRFRRVEDIMRVPGIGRKTFVRIRPEIRVR